jgi:MFS family permease
MIPYAFATFFTPLAGILSDRIQQRALVLLLCLATSIIGLVILISTTTPSISMVGCCFVATGSYSGLTIAAAYIVINHAGYTKRASALALAQILAQLSSIMSTQIYTKPPHYYMGHGIILGFNALGFICTVVMYFIMKRANKRRDEAAARCDAEGTVLPGVEKTFEELCDKHPKFRYSL